MEGILRSTTMDEFENVFLGQRILVAEEDECYRVRLIALLHKLGFHVETVCNGFQVFDILENTKDGAYDYVLFDTNSTGIENESFVKQIRKSVRKYLKTIPLIAFSHQQDDVMLGEVNAYVVHEKDPLQWNLIFQPEEEKRK